VEISENEVVLDANHPLAGQALTFEIQLTAIN
jgi:peptidylprolyl isomerase